MNKIAIFGLGAIGSVLSKYLLKNKKNQLFFFNRSPKKEINILFEGQLTSYPVELGNSSKGSFDWIIVCLKTYHLDEAKDSIRKLIRPETKLAVFRNGLKLSADFQEIILARNILETIIDCPVQLQSDKSYLQLRSPKIILPDLPLSNAFKLLFANSELNIQVTNKFKVAQWKKLIESASLGALQVLHENTCVIFKDPKIAEEYLQLIHEGIAVANSEEVNISIEFKTELLKKLKTYPETKSSSMLADELAGRPLELDAKIGIIVKIGLKNRVDIPTLRRTYKELLSLS